MEKINKYKNPIGSYFKDNDNTYTFISYQLDDFNISNGFVKVRFRKKYSTGTGTKKYESIDNYIDSADIKIIDRIGFVPFNICTKGSPNCWGSSEALAIILNCSCADEVENGNKKEARKIWYLYLLLSGSEETELTGRIQTAFDKLKTFYPKPKETF